MALATAAAPAAHASAGRPAAPRVELRGTVSPLVAQGSRPRRRDAQRDEAGDRGRRVQAPKRDPAPLARDALDGPTGDVERRDRPPVRPRPATVAAVRSYLNANGLSVVDSSDMSLVVSGTAAAANHAFGVGLRLYRDARGFTYQAPSGNVRLPKGIASVVQSVGGLDTSLKLHPQYRIAKHAATAGTAAVASCRTRSPAATRQSRTPGSCPRSWPTPPRMTTAPGRRRKRRIGPSTSGSSSSPTTAAAT